MMDCVAFEERLPAWLEGGLSDADVAAMERHRNECAACGVLVADLDALVQSAGALPVLKPSRDLWSGVEARLTTSVVPIALHQERTALRQRTSNVRLFAVAAAVLVAVTSGITWTVARSRFAPEAAASAVAVASPNTTAPAAGAPTSPSASPQPAAPEVTSSVTVASATPDGAGRTTDGASAVRNAGRQGERGVVRAASMEDVDAIYEREIAALRQIVNRRFATLDTSTVNALRHNLETIDKAIEDSRRALANDPRSGLLSTELDRTLEAKLALMRRVALL